MSVPMRVQRRRTKGWQMPPNTACVTRPTRFGNPFRVGLYRNYTADDALRDYRKWLERDPTIRSAENVFGQPPTPAEIVRALRGKNLACWCKPGEPCHADVLLEIANRAAPDRRRARTERADAKRERKADQRRWP